MIHGQSLTTIDKERKIGAMFSMQAQLYGLPNVLGTHGAFHIDLNAGCGHNNEYDVPGSPMVFLEVMLMRDPAIPFKAWFIDRDACAIAELQERIRATFGKLDNVQVACMDNKDALALIDIHKTAVGSILLDPNGWLCRNQITGAGVPPIGDLCSFVRDHPRLDLLMNLNARHYRLACGKRDDFPELYSVSDFHWLFRKEHWLITHPAHNGHTSFVCLTGRNYKYGDYKAYDWHHLMSPLGMQICENLEIDKRRPKDEKQWKLPF